MSAAVLDASTLETLIAAAVTAPSIHNSQPWRFRLDPDDVALEIRAADRHGLRHIDPQGRALHLSIGCAIFNLRVAVAHFGWTPVARLLPRPTEPDLLAVVPLSSAVTGRSTRLSALYGALWRRHSSRFPFSSRPLPRRLLGELAMAAQAEGSLLTHPGPAETDRLLQLMWEAERLNTADAGRAAGSRRLAHGIDGTGLGIPPAALGHQDARERIPMRDFAAHRHPTVLVSRPFEKRPSISVLSTVHDRRVDWLRAGQALERVLLVATTHGVRTSLLHQALEWPDLRERLASEQGIRPAHAHMVIRLGYGPEGPPSPRLTVRQVLDDSAVSPRRGRFSSAP